MELFCHHAKLAAIFVLLHISIELTATSSAAAARVQSHPQNDDTEFIKTTCGATLYAKLCFETLSPHANSIQSRPAALANAALAVSLKSAESTLDSVMRLLKRKHLSPGEAHAISDCVENMKDSVAELRDSLAEMKDLEGEDFEKRMGNVMTWVSAALTDEDTCMDGFQGNEMNAKIKSSIRSSIVNVAQLTSISLALLKHI